MKKRALSIRGARGWAATALRALALAALLPAGFAHAQLRNVTLSFRPPADARVVGFHVYVAAMSNGYSDYRDNINFIPPVNGSGVAQYALTGIEQFQNVYVAVKSYDADGHESGFSNEIVVPAQQMCLVTGCNDNNSCTVDTCTATGCQFDPAPLRGNTCDDKNAMTFNDMCQTNGSCSGTVAQCNVDTDCGAPADLCAGPKACVNHMCVAGSTPRPDETTCNDGSTATKYDVCRSGVCRGFACGSDSQCGDGAICNGAERCVANACTAGPPAPDETTCSDGNSGTKYDVCRSGMCRGFACGNDSQCSDGAACNGAERCVSNSCAAGTPMVCGDGNVCNGTETCVGSACVAGTAMQCPTDDGPCFDAFCDPAQGCRVQMHPDGEMCSTQMSGAQGQCASGVCVAMPTNPPPPDPNDSAHTPRPPPTSPNASCANVYGAPVDVRQELTTDSETTRKLVWEAPLHPMGSLFQVRLESMNEWKTLRAVPKKQNGCQATYSLTLQNLVPGGRYRYRVSGAAPDARVWTEGYMLTPGPSPTSTRPKFKFAFVAGNGLTGSAQSPEATQVLDQIRKGRFPLVLGGGGYALSTEAIAAGAATNAADAIGKWKAQAAAVTANSVFAPVLGDTEVESFAHAERATDYAEFTPLAGTTTTPYQSYSFDFGTTHFLAVNAPTFGTIHPSTSAGAAHLAWIDADLTAARARGVRWIIVYLHADLFSSEKQDAPQNAIRTSLGPILYRNGVNLVLSGEGDSYERTRGMRGNNLAPGGMPVEGEVTTATDGVVFVRSGAGGRTAFQPWLRTAQPVWSAFRDNAHASWVQVSVSDSVLQLTTYALDENGKRVTLDTLKIF